MTGFLSSQRHTYLKLGSAIGCISGVGLVVKPKFLIHFFRPGNEDLYLGSSLGFAFAMMGVLGGVVGDPSFEWLSLAKPHSVLTRPFRQLEAGLIHWRSQIASLWALLLLAALTLLLFLGWTSIST